MTPPADALLETIGRVLLCAGAGVVALALFLDSVRQLWRDRRRCPKCWYDLSASPGLTCSECGYTARRERSLRRGRRRWWLAFLGLLVVAGGVAAMITPDVRRRGWLAPVPAFALIASLPWIDDPPPWWPQVGAGVLRELAIRISLDELTDAQRTMLIERCLEGDRGRRPVSDEWFNLYGNLLHIVRSRSLASGPPDWLPRAERLVEADLQTRARWPAGTPILGRPIVHRWDREAMHMVRFHGITPGLRDSLHYETGQSSSLYPRAEWHDDLLMLGAVDASVRELRWDVRVSKAFADEHTLHDHVLAVPVTVDGTIGDLLAPVRDEAVDSFLEHEFRPTLIVEERDVVVAWLESGTTFTTDGPMLAKLSDMTLAIRATVLLDGEPVAVSRFWHGFAPRDAMGLLSPLQTTYELVWIDGAPAALVPGTRSARWRVRLVSDPEFALRNFEQDRYWEGEVELPLEVVFE